MLARFITTGLFLSAVGLPGQSPGLQITEILASNDRGLTDQDRDSSDWLEIHHPGTGLVDLGGHYLTDSWGKLTKWRFPTPTKIGPGGYQLVFASGKDRAVAGKELHTNFELDAGGECLALVAPDGKTVISVYTPSFPRQFTDVSYGQALNKGPANRPVYFLSPTPGKANTAGDSIITSVTHRPRQPKPTDDIIVEAVIEHPTGAKTSSAQLHHLVGYGKESSLKMTDDGKGADRSANDGTWTTVIPRNTASLNQMIRWRVTAFATPNKSLRSPLYLNSNNSPRYFGTVIENPALTSRAPIYHWFISNPSRARTSSGTRCCLYYGDRLYDNVFVRIRGGKGARGWNKRLFKFDFNTGHPFQFDPLEEPAEEINLNSTWSDKSFVRQILSWETFRDAGSAHCLSFPVHLRQNGGFHSLAIFVEQPDERMLRRNNLDPRGALYKMFNTLGTAASSKIEKKTRQWESTNDLAQLVNGITSASQSNRETYLFDNVDLPAVVNYLAATTLVHDNDHPHKNYYVYRNTNGDGEWQFLPWDKDLTFGRNYISGRGVLNDTLWAQRDPQSHPLFGDSSHPKIDGFWNHLINACHRTPRIRAMFTRRLRTLMDELLQSPGIPRTALRYEKNLDRLKKRLDPDVALDRQRWGVPSWGNRSYDFATSLRRLETGYLQPRRQHLFVTHSSNPGGIIPGRQTTGVKLVFGAIETVPLSGNAAESFVEIVNNNTEAVDLTGWWLDGGINFRFAAGTVIPARESAFLSPDPRAFRARKSDPRGGKKNFVIGPYSGALQPNEAISLYNASHQLIANLGGIAYDLASQGKGDLDLKVSGVAPGSRIFVIFSANTRHRLGCGPLLGMGMDALGTLTLPPNTQPFHVRADNNGEYRFIARPGTLPRQLTIDSRALQLDFQAKKILTSRILRVTL